MLNPNEPEAVLVEWRVHEGRRVESGDVLCVLETSKSTDEVAAEFSGYAVGVVTPGGAMVTAGDLLCHIAPSPDWAPTVAVADPIDNEVATPPGLRISQPALALARSRGVNLAALPVGPLVTVAMVEALSAASCDALGEAALKNRVAPALRGNVILIYGGGGHGRTLIDLLRTQSSFTVAGVVDRGLEPHTVVGGAEVLGGDEALEALVAAGIGLAANGVGGIARSADRMEAFERLVAAGFSFPTLVHPRAVLEPGATIAEGAQILALSYVGSQSTVGFGCIVNTSAVVSHDCDLSDYVNISPGALLAGGVRVGKAALIGMGVTVNVGVSIGERARVGNGAVVKADVPAGRIVPAGSVWPLPGQPSPS